MSITRDEIIATALQLERDGRAFYLEAAGKAGSEVVKQVLEHLAADELLHIEWIEETLPGVESGTQANKDLYGKLRPLFADASDTEKERAAAAPGDIEALEYAKQIEEKAQTAYQAWADATDDAEVRNLCTVLAETEAFHADLITNTIDYLHRPSEWFQQQERWLFDGG